MQDPKMGIKRAASISTIQKVLLVVEFSSSKVSYFSRPFLLSPFFSPLFLARFASLEAVDWALHFLYVTTWVLQLLPSKSGGLLQSYSWSKFQGFSRSVADHPSSPGPISLCFCPLRSKIEPVASWLKGVDKIHLPWPIQAACWVTTWSARQDTS